MPPPGVHQPVAEHPVPLLPMPHTIRVEQQLAAAQLPREAQNAHHGGNQYDENRDDSAKIQQLEKTAEPYRLGYGSFSIFLSAKL